MRRLTGVLAAMAAVNQLHAAAAELRTCELRIEPSWSVPQICATVDRVKAMGMNGIRVETFYHGGTIYRSAVMKHWGLPEIRPDFAARPSALSALVKAAHEKGVKVYAWVETFYVWNTTLGPGNPILTKYPGWSVRNSDGSLMPKRGEQTYCFISPANLQARRFIKDLYIEIARIGVDGILIDYLRYPVRSLGPRDPLSFDNATLRRSKAELGLDPSTLKLDIGDPDFARWTAWREQQTTDFARELGRALKTANPKLLIAASVHPYSGSDWRIHDTLRDWPKWYPEISVFSPQYYAGVETAAEWATEDSRNLGAKAFLWPNLLERDIEDGSPILTKLRGPRVIGFSHWQYSALTDADAAALRAGPYKNDDPAR